MTIPSLLGIVPHAARATACNQAADDISDVHFSESTTEFCLLLYTQGHGTEAFAFVFVGEKFQPVDRNTVVV